jgi:hypothetical protein
MLLGDGTQPSRSCLHAWDEGIAGSMNYVHDGCLRNKLMHNTRLYNPNRLTSLKVQAVSHFHDCDKGRE